VLRLDGEWDALHWFDAVRAKYAQEKATLNSQRQTMKAAEEENLQHTMTLTGRRLEMYQQVCSFLSEIRPKVHLTPSIRLLFVIEISPPFAGIRSPVLQLEQRSHLLPERRKVQ